LLLALVLAIVVIVIRWVTRTRTVVIAPTWDCGFPLSERSEITGASFSRSLVTIFRGVLRPTKQSTVEYHDERTRYFVKSATIETGLHDIYRERLYRPIDAALSFLANRIRRVQTGNVNMYILYFALALVGALLWASRS